MKARKATPLARIQLLILDVDGVLTDGRLYFSAQGEALKVFHVRDGHGIKLLMAAGVAVAAFSGRRSRAVAARMKELRVPHLVQACSDKVAALQRLTQRLDIDPLNCACIVDDTPDLPLMSAVGMAGAVADAHPVVRSAAHWIAKAKGGRRGGARTVRRHAARPRRPTLMLFRVFTIIAVVALGISTWILTGPARHAAAAAQRQAGGPAGVLFEECRAHRL